MTSRSQKLGVGKGDSRIAKNSYFFKMSWIISSVLLHVGTWNSTLWWILFLYNFRSCFEKIELNRVGQLHPKLEIVISKLNTSCTKNAIKTLVWYWDFYISEGFPIRLVYMSLTQVISKSVSQTVSQSVNKLVSQSHIFLSDLSLLGFFHLTQSCGHFKR